MVLERICVLLCKSVSSGLFCFVYGKKDRFKSTLLLVTGKEVYTKCLLKLA